jgi:hypothetical protein
MRAVRKAIRMIVIICFAVAVYHYIVLPAAAPNKKLTGNQVTLAMCRWELATWRDYQTNSPVFDFSQLTDDQKRRVIMFGLSQDFSIRTNFIWDVPPARKIVIVSSRVYDNVPVPPPWNLFWRNAAHAVGYSDGTTGLISEEEFDHLNLFGLASLWSLANNPDFKIFKQ